MRARANEAFSSTTSTRTASPGAPPATNTALPLAKRPTASAPFPMRSMRSVSSMNLDFLSFDRRFRPS